MVGAWDKLMKVKRVNVKINVIRDIFIRFFSFIFTITF